jgi:hypothetical protein
MLQSCAVPRTHLTIDMVDFAETEAGQSHFIAMVFLEWEWFCGE